MKFVGGATLLLLFASAQGHDHGDSHDRYKDRKDRRERDGPPTKWCPPQGGRRPPPRPCPPPRCENPLVQCAKPTGDDFEHPCSYECTPWDDFDYEGRGKLKKGKCVFDPSKWKASYQYSTRGDEADAKSYIWSKYSKLCFHLSEDRCGIETGDEFTERCKWVAPEAEREKKLKKWVDESLEGSPVSELLYDTSMELWEACEETAKKVCDLRPRIGGDRIRRMLEARKRAGNWMRRLFKDHRNLHDHHGDGDKNKDEHHDHHDHHDHEKHGCRKVRAVMKRFAPMFKCVKEHYADLSKECVSASKVALPKVGILLEEADRNSSHGDHHHAEWKRIVKISAFGFSSVVLVGYLILVFRRHCLRSRGSSSRSGASTLKRPLLDICGSDRKEEAKASVEIFPVGMIVGVSPEASDAVKTESIIMT